MKKWTSPRARVAGSQLGKGLALAALALGLETGCTREFFREWANQDVTEAIFEKSRDPRFRLDIFSDRAAGLVAVRRPLRSGRSASASGRRCDRGALAGAAVARQPVDRSGRGNGVSRDARALAKRDACDEGVPGHAPRLLGEPAGASA